MFFIKKKLNYEPRKLAKTMRLFVEIKHVKNWGVTFLAGENQTAISHAMEQS